MEKKIVLIGGGGHARSIAECIGPDSGIIGYTSLYEEPDMPLEYIGTDDDFLEKYPPDCGVEIHCALVYNQFPDMKWRKRIMERFDDYRFATLTASTALVTRNSEIGDGSLLMHRCVVNRSRLGRNCVVNTGAVIEHDCRLGDNVFVGPGAIFGGNVEVGSDVFIGLGATIKPGVRIESGIVVGMGAVVTRDLTQPGIYAGHPARLSKSDNSRKL